MTGTLSRLLFFGATALAATLLAAPGSGCRAVGGRSGISYVNGDLEAGLDATFDQAVNATNKAIGQLRFAKVSEKKDALVDTIVANDADEKRIQIQIESDGAERTKLRIRVSVMGDQALSRSILEKIQANL